MPKEDTRGRSANNGEEDDLEFVVTEAHQESPDLVGMDSKPSKPGIDDDLGLQSTADLMDDLSQSEQHESVGVSLSSTLDNTPIGDSAPPLPPAPEPSLTDSKPIGDSAPPLPPAPEPLPPEISPGLQSPAALGAVPEPEPNRLKKLSDKEVNEINKDLYGDSSYLTEAEKQNLVMSMEAVDKQEPKPEPDRPLGNGPIQPPKKNQTKPLKPEVPVADENPDLRKPAMAKRQRGIAFYYRNFIQVPGVGQFHDNDTLLVSDREYMLKKKVFSPKLIAAVTAPLFALLLIIVGMQFISEGGSGTGSVVGVVLDEQGRPYLERAEIRFPEAGKTIRANAQGFFSTVDIPTGSHQIEYVIAGMVVGSDYTTVTDGEITTLVLRPSPELTNESAESRQSAELSQAPAVTRKPVEKSESAKKPTQKKQSASKPKKASEAKLALKANVEGATIALDDKVIGAGNLSYSKLKPGTHSYKVSKKGFETVSGSIKLEGNKTRTLEVTLAPLTQTAREEVFTADDFFESGIARLRDGNTTDAIADFSSAIAKKPSHAEAHFSRAQAYDETKYYESAQADFIRAAEIFQFRSDFNHAITSYTKAVEIDKKALPPLLGRGKCYLAKGEEIAAISDFEAALKIDKKNSPARFGLGKARFNQGYYKKAVKEFKKARKEQPDNVEVHQYLMLSYMAASDVKNVKKSYEKFQKVATQEELEKLRADQRFVAIMRIIDSDS